MTGWGCHINQWPQDLKDQYAYNPTAAKQLLAAAGYPNGFNTDVVADTAADLDLLQIVKSYFAAVGIDMDIQDNGLCLLDRFLWQSLTKLTSSPTAQLGHLVIVLSQSGNLAALQ